MSLAALLLHVAATWAILFVSGWALLPASVHASPPLLRCLAIHLTASAAIAVVGIAVVALDLGTLGAHALLWLALGAGLAVRARAHESGLAGFAREHLPRRAIHLVPLLLALAYGAHSLSVVHQDVYGDEFDWRKSSLRNYRLLDGDLQYRVADAFLHDDSVEKHFLDAGLVWSAGDRPMLMAAIYTAFARLLGVQNVVLYRLTLILFAAFVLIAIHALLQFVIGLPPLARLAVTATTALHPFVLANIEFTWPKMTGVAFALSGFVLIVAAMRVKDAPGGRASFWLGALGLAFAPLCHGTLIFGVACLFGLALWLGNDGVAPLRARALRLAIALLPTIGLLAVQAVYNAEQTRSTQLGVRIALCSEGSALYKTPPMTLGEACAKYWARKGFAGFVSDRVANLKRVFLLEAGAFAKPFGGVASVTDFQRVTLTQMLQVPIYSAGLVGHLALIALAFACFHPAIRAHVSAAPEAPMILAAAWLTTIAFALLMSETSELTSRGVPLTQPVLGFVAMGALALQYLPRLAFGLLGAYALFALALLANDEGLFGFIPDGSLLLLAAVLAIAAFALLGREDRSAPGVA